MISRKESIPQAWIQSVNLNCDNDKHCTDTRLCVETLRMCFFPGLAGRHGRKMWSLASTRALIEVQLRLQHYKQLQWRLSLLALQAELRVLQRQRTWALLFHVCHRWQPERHILASMFWKCVWLHEIFISLPAFWQCAYLFIYFKFSRYLRPVQSRYREVLEMIPST